jgi:hypothetical protein
MNEDDKDLIEAAAKGMTDSALEPIKQPLMNIAGPFTKEVGLLLALPVKWWRFKYSLEIMERAKRLLDQKGVEVQPVPIKILAPILEIGCLEEEDSMLDHWAALLASAADPTHKQAVLPSFAQILGQLSSIEAAILDRVYGNFVVGGSWSLELNKSVVLIEGNFDDIDRSQLAVLFDNLKRFDLLRLWPGFDIVASMHPQGFLVTRLGFAFVSACRPPNKPTPVRIQKCVENKWVTTIEPPQ